MKTQKHFNKLNQGGFSLVELLVVIAIIAILSVTAYLTLGGQTDKAKDSRVQSDLSAIETSLDIMKIETGSFPTELVVGEAQGQIPKEYLRRTPVDPSGQAYAYAYDANTNTYQVGGVLKNSGIMSEFETVLVGPGTDILRTNGVDFGFYFDGSGFTACANDLPITAGQVTQDINAADDGSCIPYNPLNSI